MVEHSAQILASEDKATTTTTPCMNVELHGLQTGLH